MLTVSACIDAGIKSTLKGLRGQSVKNTFLPVTLLPYW